MQTRRTLGALMALAIGAAAFGSAGQALAQDKPTVALIPGLTTDAFYITMHKGAQAAADEMGVELIFQGGPEFNPTVQVPVLQAVIARQPDVILIAPTDKQQLIAPLRQAVDAGGHRHRARDVRDAAEALVDQVFRGEVRTGGVVDVDVVVVLSRARGAAAVDDADAAREQHHARRDDPEARRERRRRHPCGRSPWRSARYRGNSRQPQNRFPAECRR